MYSVVAYIRNSKSKLINFGIFQIILNRLAALRHFNSSFSDFDRKLWTFCRLVLTISVIIRISEWILVTEAMVVVAVLARQALHIKALHSHHHLVHTIRTSRSFANALNCI